MIATIASSNTGNRNVISCKSNESYCDVFLNKKSEGLFGVQYWFDLKCDSTYEYFLLSCTYGQTSYGRWTYKDGKIILLPCEEIITMIKFQKKKKSCCPRYDDLSNKVLVVKDSFLLWNFMNFKMDTLSRREPLLKN